MKTPLLAVFALLCTSVAFAKPTPPPNLIDGSTPVPPWVLKKLSPELQKRVEAAQTKAMEEPGIREEREKITQSVQKLRERVREAMTEIDPGLREAIKAEMPNAKFGSEKKAAPEGIAGMDSSERKQLLAAREAVKDDPSVVSAREALERAATPDERKAAGEAYREAMKAALKN